MNSIDRYMARLIAVPLISTLLISAMLLVLDRMLRLFEFVATEGGPVSVVWRMLANLLPEYLGLGILDRADAGLPAGLSPPRHFVRTRRAARGGDEATRACSRCLHVRDGAGGAESRHRRLHPALVALHYEQLRFELRSGALGASIKVGEFTSFGAKMTMRIEDSKDEGRRLCGHLRPDDDQDGTPVAGHQPQSPGSSSDDRTSGRDYLPSCRTAPSSIRTGTRRCRAC